MPRRRTTARPLSPLQPGRMARRRRSRLVGPLLVGALAVAVAVLVALPLH